MARVLVVHDDTSVAEELKAALSEEGYAVALAQDGPLALEMLSHNEYDVLLLELILPRMHGFQVLEHLQGDAQLCHLPVIVMSPHERRRELTQGLEMGATDYLTYPIEPAFLRPA